VDCGQYVELASFIRLSPLHYTSRLALAAEIDCQYAKSSPGQHHRLIPPALFIKTAAVSQRDARRRPCRIGRHK
jgi:hypothetical protein